MVDLLVSILQESQKEANHFRGRPPFVPGASDHGYTPHRCQDCVAFCPSRTSLCMFQLICGWLRCSVDSIDSLPGWLRWLFVLHLLPASSWCIRMHRICVVNMLPICCANGSVCWWMLVCKIKIRTVLCVRERSDSSQPTLGSKSLSRVWGHACRLSHGLIYNARTVKAFGGVFRWPSKIVLFLLNSPLNKQKRGYSFVWPWSFAGSCQYALARTKATNTANSHLQRSSPVNWRARARNGECCPCNSLLCLGSFDIGFWLSIIPIGFLHWMYESICFSIASTQTFRPSVPILRSLLCRTWNPPRKFVFHDLSGRFHVGPEGKWYFDLAWPPCSQCESLEIWIFCARPRLGFKSVWPRKRTPTKT